MKKQSGPKTSKIVDNGDIFGAMQKETDSSVFVIINNGHSSMLIRINTSTEKLNVEIEFNEEKNA